MPGSASSLPPELLIRICDFMQTKGELANFSQCSRQFHGVAAAHLYRHIDLLTDTSFDHINWKDNVSAAIEALVRTFLRNPSLGELVQKFHIRLPEASRTRIRPMKPLPLEYENLIRELLPDSFETHEQTIPSHGDTPSRSSLESTSGSEWESTDESADEDEVEVFDDPDKPLPKFQTEAERWIYLATRSSVVHGNVMLTILLSFIPNVEFLDLELPSPGLRTAFLDRTLQRSMVGSSPVKTRPFLPNLHSICCGCTAPHQRGDSWVGPFILPTLTSIYLHRISGIGSSLAMVSPGTLSVSHLELRDCRIAPTSLVRLLAAPKALKTFIYVVGEVQTSNELYMPLSYKSIRIALESQKDSLERVWLDYPHDYMWDDDSTQHTNPMDSFSIFSKLKYLRIAGTYIFGFVHSELVDPSRLLRALPEQLEVLHITHADEDEETFEGISAILDAKVHGRLRKLRILKLEAPHKWYIMNGTELSQMLEVAQRVDLQVRLLDNHSDTRIEIPWKRRHAAFKFAFSTIHPRRESPWGFDRETIWPERVSGCMQLPVYEDISNTWLNLNPYKNRMEEPGEAGM